MTQKESSQPYATHGDVPVFQGDIMVRRVECVPPNVQPATEMAHGGYVVAHSETGHHHVATGAEQHWLAADGMTSWLVAKGDVEVTHHRAWDTHQTYRLLHGDAPGEVVWEITRQQEHSPMGARRVED
jgi:hypothetical protein